MNHFVFPDWVLEESLKTLSGMSAHSRRIAQQYAAGRMAEPEVEPMPSFDHIPTEIGRAASRKLWEATRPVK